MEKKIEIISKQLIKPAICHVESFNLSAIDQLAPPTHYPIFLYYPNDQESTNLSTRSLQLKSSLSKILADFYPFAGRLINNNSSISCNSHKDDDIGVLFIEAFARNYNLQEILLCINTSILGQFVPQMDSPLKNHLLIVQVTFFECGGMILGCWVSHKLSDATSICTFINNWAATARGANNSNSLTPNFKIGVKVFPPTKQPSRLPFASFVGGQEEQTVTKVFSFDGPSIADLKSKALSKDVPAPTRVEAVSALIWKCATSTTYSPTSSLSYLSHAVNLRKWSVPASFPDEIMGNFIAFYWANKGENDKDLSILVAILRKGLSQFHNTCTRNLISSPILENWKMHEDLITRSDIELYVFSSWCGMPFYDADFGWGKPVWFSMKEFVYKNIIILMDSKNGGIEAWICLEAKHMEQFEQHPDLLKFASIKN
ncbi:stemmadenine O-acetyltransferase-like [Lycium barbarum]|uniref:stemmadenine O-acetyltransferase-like n=1 Tax=Lycium barbarum TaxID=112863 RepID=UPI00293E65A5|nr:stemmadenine O-acetyltransferase-like [Lycium barbarum]